MHGLSPAPRSSIFLGVALLTACFAVPVPAVHPAPRPAAVYLVPAGRSPLVQAGESIRTPIPAPRLRTEPGPVEIGDPVATIDWDAARRYVGKVVTVEGKVVKTGTVDSRKAGRLYFLNFVEQWRDEFYVVIFEEALGGWPMTPDKHFHGATIRVTGIVTLHRQTRPQIAVRRADQIAIVPSMEGGQTRDP